MRNLIIALSALAIAAPAAAQSRSDPRDEEIVRALPAPERIEELGDTMGRVAEAIMDVPIGPIVDALDPARRGRHRNETLGDVAARDDPYARERIRDQVGAATVGLGAVMEEFAAVAPVLRRSLEDAGRRMEEAMEDRRRSRERERGERERNDRRR
jgi:hypothetical protein